MDIHVFKTNIRYPRHINVVGAFISNQPGIIHWNVDLKDEDRILRVVSTGIHPRKIEGIVKMAGYQCEELKD